MHMHCVIVMHKHELRRYCMLYNRQLPIVISPIPTLVSATCVRRDFKHVAQW
jgi:hypothetical protein